MLSQHLHPTVYVIRQKSTANICGDQWQHHCLPCAPVAPVLCTDTLSEAFIHSLTPLLTVWHAALFPLTTSGLSRCSPSQPSPPPPPLPVCWLYPLCWGRRKREQWAREWASGESRPRPKGGLKAGLCSPGPSPWQERLWPTVDNRDEMNFDGKMFIWVSSSRRKHCYCSTVAFLSTFLAFSNISES